MRDSREIRYYASIPKAALLAGLFVAFSAFGWHARTPGNVIDWVMIGFFGLVTLGALTALVFAVMRRKPVLAINDIGITYLPPGKAPNVTVLWDDATRISIDTAYGARGLKSYYLAVQARHPDRYASVHQRVMIGWLSAGHDVAIAVPLDLLFLWALRARREQMLQRIQQTFAPEIILYGVEVEEPEPPV